MLLCCDNSVHLYKIKLSIFNKLQERALGKYAMILLHIRTNHGYAVFINKNIFVIGRDISLCKTSPYTMGHLS